MGWIKRLEMFIGFLLLSLVLWFIFHSVTLWGTEKYLREIIL